MRLDEKVDLCGYNSFLQKLAVNKEIDPQTLKLKMTNFDGGETGSLGDRRMHGSLVGNSAGRSFKNKNFTLADTRDLFTVLGKKVNSDGYIFLQSFKCRLIFKLKKRL